MPTTSIIATALGGGAAGPSWGLFIGGTDVRGRVPLHTIEVQENGPDGVSSMRFTIEDPLSEVTLNVADEVFYQNNTTDVPEFRGFVQTWQTHVFALGRDYEVTAVGVEAILDWCTLPELTLQTVTGPAGSERPSTWIAVMVAAAYGPAGLLRIDADASTGHSSTVDTPVELTGSSGSPVGGHADLVIPEGTSLREGLRMLAEYTSGRFDGPDQFTYTVDYWYGLRWWRSTDDTGAAAVPIDYAALTIVDTVAGPIQAAGQDHEVDAGGVVRGVYLKGGNAAGSGFLSDGTGKVGPVSFLNDETVLTSLARDIVLAGYLAGFQESVRGNFRRETFLDTGTSAAHIQAGSLVTITDAQIGLSAVSYVIASINKVYFGANLETWTVGYGGLPPSFPRAVRRLTRGIRS